MTLFVKESFISHSGLPLNFKIECDALTETDWRTLAYIVHRKFQFKFVYGIPRGGVKLSVPLLEYQTDDVKLPVLIVDDVFTTGGSMEKTKAWLESYWPNEDYLGVVAFSRGKTPNWIHPIFQLWEE